MQQWVKKVEISIEVQISQSASSEKTASAEVGTILDPVNSPLHQDSVRVQRQKRLFTSICSRNWFTILLVLQSTHSGGYPRETPSEARAETQAQAQA